MIRWFIYDLILRNPITSLCLLPKLHGSRKKLEQVLSQLWKLCFSGAGKDLNIAKENVEKAEFKESAAKIRRMYESATANGFTSFAEA